MQPENENDITKIFADALDESSQAVAQESPELALDSALSQKKSFWEGWAAGLLGLAVIIGGAGAAYWWLNTQVYTPERQVVQHLHHLVAGELNQALALAPQEVGAAAAPLSEDAVKAAKNRYTDQQIKSVAVNGDKATVVAQVRQNGNPVELTYKLQAGQTKQAMLFTTWSIPSFKYPVITTKVNAAASLLNVNGQHIDLNTNAHMPEDIRDEAEISFMVLPGDYKLTTLSRTEFFNPAGEKNFSVASADTITESGDGELALKLNDAGVAEVKRLANAQIDACLQQTVSAPVGCNFEAWTISSYKDGSWELGSYPELVVNTDRGVFAGGGKSEQGAAGRAVFHYTSWGNRRQREAKIYADGYYTVMPDHTIKVFFSR